VKRVLIRGVFVVGIATLVFGCERSSKSVGPKGVPNPEADPLAQPKSLQQVGVPVEATRAAIPADSPQTPEKISLGQRLFFERRLSVDSTVSCSTCHDPKLAFTDKKPLSIGIKGRVGQRNAPTILNALYQ
jgi:cytochrome c peroxidase